MLLAPYVQLMAELALQQRGLEGTQPLRYFFVGGGAYTLPRGFKALDLGAGITVAELDPLVTETAKRYLFLDPRGMRIIHADARVVLQRFKPGRFDVIVGDAFYDVSLPYHLVTREYAGLVKSRLAPKGLYLLNVSDVYSNPELVKSIWKTLAGEFRYVSVWLDRLPRAPVRQTFVLAASDAAPFPDRITSQRGMRRSWYRINKPLAATGTPLPALPVLTDDYVPVERLIAPLLVGEYGL